MTKLTQMGLQGENVLKSYLYTSLEERKTKRY